MALLGWIAVFAVFYVFNREPDLDKVYPRRFVRVGSAAHPADLATEQRLFGIALSLFYTGLFYWASFLFIPAGSFTLHRTALLFTAVVVSVSFGLGMRFRAQRTLTPGRRTTKIVSLLTGLSLAAGFLGGYSLVRAANRTLDVSVPRVVDVRVTRVDFGKAPVAVYRVGGELYHVRGFPPKGIRYLVADRREGAFGIAWVDDVRPSSDR